MDRSKPNYNLNLGYRPEYKKAHWWVRYDDQPDVEGMFCSVCESGVRHLREIMCMEAWVRAAFNTWKKATEKLHEHEKSEGHKNALFKSEMVIAADKNGSVLTQQIVSARRQADAEKARNRLVLKKLLKCAYFLIKYKAAHTTTFVPLADLLIVCDDSGLKLFFFLKKVLRKFYHIHY